MHTPVTNIPIQISKPATLPWAFIGKVNLYPGAIDQSNLYDDIKIHPCKVAEILEDKVQIEECTEEEAEFYALYGYALGENYDGLHCIADGENKESAEKLRELLIGFAQNYRQMFFKDVEGSPFFEG